MFKNSKKEEMNERNFQFEFVLMVVLFREIHRDWKGKQNSARAYDKYHVRERVSEAKYSARWGIEDDLIIIVGFIGPSTQVMHKRSLNSEVRKKELMKITIENQTILRRLQDKTSNYSV